VYTWEPAYQHLTEDELRILNRDFILDVMLIQTLRMRSGPAAEGLQYNDTGYTQVPMQSELGMPNSCCFHEHLELDPKSCRARLEIIPTSSRVS
jgi:hypothetical protein